METIGGQALIEGVLFQNGGKVCNLRLAVTEKWKNKNGEKQEKTEWVSVAIFGDGLATLSIRR